MQPSATTGASRSPIWARIMTEGKPLLRVRDLHAWHDESHIPHGVDLTVCEGETVIILGHNGMGKTTTPRSGMGILRKRSGAVEFAGKALTHLPSHYSARAGIGYVPEERGIFATLSVGENLLPPVVSPAWHAAG